MNLKMNKKELTGYPSKDKPWLKYYSETAINAKIPDCSIYQATFEANRDYPNQIAIDYYGNKITYGELFEMIEKVAGALIEMGVKSGDVVSVCMINSPETVFLIYALNRIGAIANMISGFSENDELIKYINDVKSSILFVLDIFLDKILSIIDKVELKKVVVSNLTESMGMIYKIGARTSKGMKPKEIPKDARFIDWKEFIKKFVEVHDVCIETTKTAVITYTGGTTGGSKGVELSNCSIISMAQQYILCETALSRGQTFYRLSRFMLLSVSAPLYNFLLWQGRQ